MAYTLGRRWPFVGVSAVVEGAPHSLFAVLQLSEWERKFLTDAPEGYAKYGGLSWKQRRSAREILSKLTWERERRKELGAWIAEARAGEPHRSKTRK